MEIRTDKKNETEFKRSVSKQILSTLAFFATGCYQKSIGQNLHLAVEQSRLSRIIAEIADAMVTNLLDEYIKFPQTAEECQAIKERFHEKHHFPGIIGAIDCTHIAIIAPNTDDPVRPGIAYYNRKGFYSLNVQMVVLGLLTNFSSIGPSMSLGFSAVALPVLKGTLTENQLSWFASCASLATPFGCFFSGPFADRFGRRRAIVVVNVVCVLGWLTITLACKDATKVHYPTLLAGRLLTGFSTGLCGSPSTAYMVEVSSAELRGVFITWTSVSFSLGVLLVYFLGSLIKDALCTISLITSALPCAGLLFTILFMPESPTWLIRKNRIEQAKASMCRIFGTKAYSTQVEAEVNALLQNRGVKKINETKSLSRQIARKIQFLLKPESLKPLGIAASYFFFQQFSGTFVIIFYAIDIVENAGISVDPYLSIVIIGIVRLFSAILGSVLSRTVGRRPLSIFSGSGMAASLLVLAAYILLLEHGGNKLTALPMVLLLAYFVTSSVGFLPLPFAVAAELFPSKIRGTASGLTSGLGYIFNFVAVKIYPDMVRLVGRKGVFCCYGVAALVGTLFVAFFLPETRGKSLQEIEGRFKEKGKLAGDDEV